MPGADLPPLAPEGPLVAWYGDDFTGSSAVMEVLAFAGYPAVLFLDVPTPGQLARFPAVRGVGIAGDARSRGPDWMDANLPRVFDALRRLGAPVVHYKICSTLDSAPHVGSIGRAADLAMAEGDWAPLVVAAPRIGRWQAFGTLFARAGERIHRLDRHPTMRAHPVTPMDEADVRLHLGRQTEKPIGLVDLVALKAGLAAERLEAERAAGARIVALDVVDEETLVAVGRLVWAAAARSPLFAIGSQGLEYALVAAWAAAGIAPPSPEPRRVAPAGRVAVASGSCSPVTAEQLAVAEARGFAMIPVDAARAVDARAWAEETDRAAAAALAALDGGRSVIVATARGPEDPAIAVCETARRAAGLAAETFNASIGAGLGALLATLTRRGGLGRVAIAGGDTSSHGARAFGLFALTAEAALAPGAPLLRGHAEAAGDGLEIALKGGQMGPPDFFVRLRDGTPPADHGGGTP
jgi:3-oxoisoapionate kinase